MTRPEVDDVALKLLHAELGGDLLRLGVPTELALQRATRGADQR